MERAGDEEGHGGQPDQHHLSGRALPGDPAQASPDVPATATVLHTAADVAEDPAGQRGVEELRSVARGDGAADA